jgi:transcription antitermination factor NusG
MRNSAILSLQAREENGIVTLPPAQELGFRPNQSVSVRRGAYSGYKGLVQGTMPNDRVQILIDYMGRKVPFLVLASDLELAA